MSQIYPTDPTSRLSAPLADPMASSTMERPHLYWRVHLFLATLLGIAGLACFATGVLVPVGILLLPIAIAWGVGAVAFGAYQRHHDRLVPYDERKEFTNM